MQVYQADGIADAVEFEFSSAIRSSPYTCPDESSGCDYTQWVECALNGAAVGATTPQKVSFLGCWDDSSASPASKASSCAVEAGLDFAAVKTCHSGAENAQLLAAAKIKFASKWPQYTKSGGPYHVPHVVVAGTDMEDPTFSNIISTLCDAGISAGACSGTVV